MSSFAVDDFVALFSAVHSLRPDGTPGERTEPFAWQIALCDRVLTTGSWPEVIDVPTGLGKTAIADIAVFTLAAQADLPPARRSAPTRTFMVVDRRLIVDQTYNRARHLRRCLLAARTGIVGQVADALRSMSAGTATPTPLEVVRMRGGTTWAWRWLPSPAQPAVIAATVDQLGSRLLFRGYGVGEHLRSIDAALTGCDSLLVLDEAHLSWPLAQTVRACQAAEARAYQPLLPRRHPRPVLLSATPPPSDPPADTFELDLSAETSAVALKRLAAQRHVHLVDLQTVTKPDQARPVLADALAELATLRLGDSRRVAVVCNTVDLAREVHRRLESAGLEPGLLIGRCRPVDQERLAKRWLARLDPDRRAPDERPTLVVATQTIEVGADLDIDALITEACPLDALLQRLGRLDRRGHLGRSQAHVVHVAALHGPRAAVYGPATSRTWTWLCDHAATPTPAPLAKLAAAMATAPSLDLGPRSLATLIQPADRDACTSTPAATPVVLAAILDSWARTSPAPEPDEPVAPFLHGLGHGRVEIPVCWRDGLPSPRDPEGLTEWCDELRSAPPAPGEIVEVPVGHLRAFLTGTPASMGADIEAEAQDDNRGPMSSSDDPAPVDGVVIRPDGTVVLANSRELRPGATLVLASDVGGHDQWGWTGVRGPPVSDVADLAAPRPRLRVRQAILNGLLGATAPPVPPKSSDDLDDLGPWLGDLARLARKQTDNETGTGWYGGQLAAMVERIRPRPVLWVGHTARWRLVRSERDGLSEAAGDEGEGLSSAGASEPVPLDRHLHDVERRARQIAEAIGLPPELVAVIGCGGLIHDPGKADHRCQIMLYGGNPHCWEATGVRLAKSGMDPADRAAFSEARRHSGWPKGMRHEAISAALLEVFFTADPARFADIDCDLLRHLVASHHGRSRPLLPPVSDAHPVEVRVSVDGVELAVSSDALLVDWDSPRRFAQLQLRYGRWGLALLETVLRLADHACSEEYATPRSAAPA